MRSIHLLIGSALLAVAGPALATGTIAYGYDAKSRLVQIARTGTVNNGVTTSDFNGVISAIGIPAAALAERIARVRPLLGAGKSRTKAFETVKTDTSPASAEANDDGLFQRESARRQYARPARAPITFICNRKD